MDTIICDKCDHYVMAISGTTETCWAKYDGSKVIIRMPDDYIKLRMTGEKRNCKGFKKL